MKSPQIFTRLWVMVVIVFGVVGDGACASIKRSKEVELINSNYSDFPYQIVIPATEVTRYNVHQLKPETAELKVKHYLFIKRRLGQLQNDEFVFSYYNGTPAAGAKSRGLVTVTADEIVIAIEVGLEKSALDRTIEKYVPCELNGRYRLVDKR